MVFGLNALFTKPAVSFAPMLSVFILNTYGYSQYKNSLSDPTAVSSEPSPELTHAMFSLTYCTSIVTGLVQIVVWSKFTIRKSHLLVSKHIETAE